VYRKIHMNRLDRQTDGHGQMDSTSVSNRNYIYFITPPGKWRCICIS